MLKLHVITGWSIPQKEVMEVLIDQLKKTMQENYSELNSEEIEFAFRAHGTGVKDWGKEMNLSLIDEVLIPYRNKRTEVSALEEKLLPPPGQAILSEDQLTNENRSITEACYQRFLDGNRVYFPSKLMHDVLVKDKIMPEGFHVGTFFHQCAGQGIKNLYTKSE